MKEMKNWIQGMDLCVLYQSKSIAGPPELSSSILVDKYLGVMLQCLLEQTTALYHK